MGARAGTHVVLKLVFAHGPLARGTGLGIFGKVVSRFLCVFRMAPYS
jgi:hypothetical protein